MRLSLLGALSLCWLRAIAVFSDEAWKVDYHHALLGAPREDTTFFHQPNPASKASLIYTLSAQGVLGAINPRDGSIVWRHLLSHNDTASESSVLRAGQGQDIVISGIGDQVAAWSAADGRQAWQSSSNGRVADVHVAATGRENSYAEDAKDVFVLSGDGTAALQRIDSVTGAVKWETKHDAGDTPYRISASTTTLYSIVWHKPAIGSLKLKVISHDPPTGRKVDEHTLSPDSEVAASHGILLAGTNSAAAVVAWADATRSNLKVNVLGSKAVSSFDIEKHDGQNVEQVRVHASSNAKSPAHFLVHYETATSHWADVFHVDAKSQKVSKAYSLPNLKGHGTFSATASETNLYFTRITRDDITTVSSASHGILGRWANTELHAEAGLDEDVKPLHAISELSIKGDSVSAVRSAVFLSTGNWLLLRDGTPVWRRLEALADIVSATFATSSAVEGFAHELELEAQHNVVQAYLHRVKRHIVDAQRLPALLFTLPQIMLRGLLGTNTDTGVAHDIFGFHKIIACVTRSDRIIALDAGSPHRILWSRSIGDTKPESGQRPQLTSPSAGILALSNGANAVSQSFNASTGEGIGNSPRLDQTRQGEQSGSNVQFALHDGQLEARMSAQNNGNWLWHFSPPSDERILSIVPRPVNDPVASIGKVLGDRRVLYKYLDLNLALVVTAKDTTNSATVYVLNTVSGAVLYSNNHINLDLTEPMASVMSENWFAYSFTVATSSTSPKGHQIVVGEMFESLVPDDRGPLSEASNFSSLQSDLKPFTLTHTYQIPEPISMLSVTQTRQGITSRQLLAVLPDSAAIVGIPYGVLDPRRPVNRDPTKDEQAEGLMKYSPVIEFDPRWYLNHQREVLGIEHIATSPALIESTSIVFAYGLDVFGTRLSPSFSFDILGKDFNKFQMLATVAALAVATFVVAPLVTRKQVNTRWQLT